MARRILLILLVLIAAGAALGGAWLYRGGRLRASAEPLALRGTVESYSIDVNARASGRIRLTAVREGDIVRAGQIVAWLEAPELRAAVRDADEQVRDAQRRLTALRATHPEQLRESAERAEAEAARAQRALEEAQTLSREAPFLAQRVERAREALEGAEILLREAQTRLAEMGGGAPGPLESGEEGSERAGTQTSEPSGSASPPKRETAQGAQNPDVAKAAEALKRAQRRRDAAARELAEAERTSKRAAEVGERLALLTEEAERAAAEAQAARADFENASALQADKSEEENLRLAVREAQAASALARTRLSEALILAPAYGLVERLNIHASAELAGGEAIATIKCLNPVVVQLTLSPRDASRIRPSQPVTARAVALPGVTFRGTVTEVTDGSTGPGGAATMKVSLENPNGRLRPGSPVIMFVP